MTDSLRPQLHAKVYAGNWPTVLPAGSYPCQLSMACGPPATPTATLIPVAPATPSATAEPTPACSGDCGGEGIVTVDELLTSVNIALGNVSLTACEAGDTVEDGRITIDEILVAVQNALNGCG